MAIYVNNIYNMWSIYVPHEYVVIYFKMYKIGRFKYVKIYVAHIWQLIWPIYLTTIYAHIWESNPFLSIWNDICGPYMSLTNMLSYMSYQYVVIYVQMYFRIYFKILQNWPSQIYVAHIWQLIWLPYMPVYEIAIHFLVYEMGIYFSVYVCS